jgi:hypothetical protein
VPARSLLGRRLHENAYPRPRLDEPLSTCLTSPDGGRLTPAPAARMSSVQRSKAMAAAYLLILILLIAGVCLMRGFA